MSFGFGVGDFLAVLELANNARKRFQDAPGEYRAISENIDTLFNVCQDIMSMSIKWEIDDKQKARLKESSNRCARVLEELGLKLKAYESLNTTAHDRFKQPSYLWKRLKWDSKEMEEFRRRIIDSTDVFKLFLSGISTNIGFELKTLAQQSDHRWRTLDQDKEREDVLNWLYTTRIDYHGQQTMLQKLRAKLNTGSWILCSPEFDEWLNQTQSALLCWGGPGTGKTVLTSVVIDHINHKFGRDPTVGIAYVYCNIARAQEQDPDHLLASILGQLIERMGSVPEEVKRLHSEYLYNRPSVPLEAFHNVLREALRSFSKSFIIVDALDELHNCQAFLSRISALRKESSLCIFVTSRFSEERFKEDLSVKVRASNEDLDNYLKNRMEELVVVEDELDLQSYVISEIKARADGMFLLAKLHMDSLIELDPGSEDELKLSMTQLKSGLEALDQKYAEMMRKAGKRASALCWIAFAKRPLTISELCHALAVGGSDSDLDKTKLMKPKNIINSCGGLIVVTDGGRLGLFHATFYEYLFRTQSIWFGDANERIATACVTYISFDHFQAQCTNDWELSERFKYYALYKYASQHWGDHIRGTSQETSPLVLDFLHDDTKVSASAQAFMRNRLVPYGASFTLSSGSRSKVPGTTGAHLSVHFGLSQSLKSLHECDTRGWKGKTPLHYAVMSESVAMAELLLGKKVDLNSKDNEGKSILSSAILSKNSSLVELLLDHGAEPNCEDSRGETPLHLAALLSQESIVRQLLKRGAEINYRDWSGLIPLASLASYGPDMASEFHQDLSQTQPEPIVRMLLENKAEVDSRSLDLRTPLSRAAESGVASVVQRLLKCGANPDIVDAKGRTALSYAAYCRWESDTKVRYILEKTTKTDLKDIAGRTPLSYAAGIGLVATMRLLLGKGADQDAKDESGRTPLSYAAQVGSSAAIELLLEEAGVDAADEYGRTPLSYAAEGGSSAAVQLLLDNGANANHEDRYGRSPLSWATSFAPFHEVEAVMTLLLDVGADIASKDCHGASPIICARSPSALKLLIKRGADVNYRTPYGWTPLAMAVNRQGEEMARVLLEHGASTDWVHPQDGCSLLEYAEQCAAGAGRKHYFWQPICELLREHTIRAQIDQSTDVSRE